jgi:predicted XRE-type DNA-binding protein
MIGCFLLSFIEANHDLTVDLEKTVTMSSGNVCTDLGYENAEEMLLKAQSLRLLSWAIKAKGLNQYQAAEVLGSISRRCRLW